MKKSKSEVKLSVNQTEVQFLRHVLSRFTPNQKNELELVTHETLSVQLEFIILKYPEFGGSWEDESC